MSKYYFLARLDFNVEIGFFFGDEDIKVREMHRRTTNMLKWIFILA